MVRRRKWSEGETDAAIKKEYGNYWSITNVFQYLSGQEALKTLNNLPNDYKHNGITATSLQLIIAKANDYCANVLPDKTISNGIKVKTF